MPLTAYSLHYALQSAIPEPQDFSGDHVQTQQVIKLALTCECQEIGCCIARRCRDPALHRIVCAKFGQLPGEMDDNWSPAPQSAGWGALTPQNQIWFLVTLGEYAIYIALLMQYLDLPCWE